MKNHHNRVGFLADIIFLYLCSSLAGLNQHS